MTHLSALKAATSLSDVAELLGFKPSSLSYILFHQSKTSKYTKFQIPKRHGGSRTICAPAPSLKLLQRNLTDLLQNCIQSIAESSGKKNEISHGFTRGRSIVTNAKIHRNRHYVFNVDLNDFFGSINFGRVRGFFIKDRNFSLNVDVATVLAQICCHDNALPQGSPCSPVVSNLIGHLLDTHLVRLASQTGCRYSRYADDLTFSTNKKEFPASIAKYVDDEHDWKVGSELSRLIKRTGFEINKTKTRMQYRDSRQEVTGLVVNRKVNIRREYRHTVRAMAHRLFTTGSFDFVRNVVDDMGTVTQNKNPGDILQLHGMLGFIHGIDLHNQFLSQAEQGSRGNSKLSSKESLYKRFLFYKEFYAAKTPVIICEGKTDNLYLLHAIRSLVAKYPTLASKSADGSISLRIRIFNFVDTSTGRILGISSGGGPNLKNFIRQYTDAASKFKPHGVQKPTIVFVDNDSGSKEVLAVVKAITKKELTGLYPFVHVANNLYVVATPLQSGLDETDTEDFFDEATRSTVVDGKSFDRKNRMNSVTHYGQIVFAHKVIVAHADKINFSAFEPILDSLVNIIDAHERLHFP